jgi:putative urate catabolism protein
MTNQAYPRDLIGYGAKPPHPQWPNDARIAVQFVVNFEEGAENCVLHGDDASEAFLSEIVGASPWPNQRHLSMESIYEYGARAGSWRLLRTFEAHQIPFTVFCVGMALERNPAPVIAMRDAGAEIASHGYRWIDYRAVPKAVERAHILSSIAAHETHLGERPLGFYQGRTGDHSRALCVEEGGFVYDADSYSDDLPYYEQVNGVSHLVVPYTLDTNDMRFASPQGFNSGTQFFDYLKDAFDVLYAEGETQPKMLSIGLHCRLAGRPARAAALSRFMEYIKQHDRVWCPRRIDIARHWLVHFPPA